MGCPNDYLMRDSMPVPPPNCQSILKLSRSGVEKTREGSKVTVLVVEKTREGSSILKLFRSEVEKTSEGSKVTVYVDKKAREVENFEAIPFPIQILIQFPSKSLSKSLSRRHIVLLGSSSSY